MGYDLCLFDLDGTLTDSKPGIVASVKYALKSLGRAIPDEDTLDLFLGPPLGDSFKEFCGFDDAGAKEAIAEYRVYLNDKGLYENSVYLGIEDLLQKLHQNGVKMAVSTSKPTVQAKKVLDHFNLARYFDLIVGSELDGTRSDKAEVIAYALEKLDSSGRVVMIGDRKHDIIGAKTNGIDCIGVEWGYAKGDEIQQFVPLAIAKSPKELLYIILN